MAETAPVTGPEAQARALLAQLSTAEKLALLAGDTSFWAGMADIALRDASHRHPWPAGQRPHLALPGLQFVDGPRGVGLKGGATTFPVPIARGASWNPQLEERIGEAIALEARCFGANWVAAVCINLLRHPGWGRAQETYGEDPVHVGAMGAAMTRGLERHAIACVKHFALNSIDSCRFLVDVQVSERVLHELYLPHFRDCVEAGAGSVMTAYNQVNGRWCAEHAGLLREILRRRWGFGGLVVSDFIFGVRDGVEAVLAGLDLEMPFQMVLAGCLPQAVLQGQVPIERVDEAVLRQLRLQLRLPAGDYPAALRGCPAHRALALQAARESIVLLRNEGAVLPFTGLHSLAVIGRLAAEPNLGDRGSSDTRPAPGTVVTPLQGLLLAAPELSISHDDGADPASAAALAARCDAAVLVLGLDWRLEGEHIHSADIAPILALMPPPRWLEALLGRRLLSRLWGPLARRIAWITSHAPEPRSGDFAAGDRTDLALPPDQVALIAAVAAANRRTVVVLMGGGAILSGDWQEQVRGLLLLWYPGQEGGLALAEVLLGQLSPSGRLPLTLPATPQHLPPFDPRARQVVYDLWHGYRRLQHQGHRAAFPFGFGLSYSRFEISAPLLLQPPDATAIMAGDHSPLTVRVELCNSGALAAAEVLQLYLEPPGRTLERPQRSLVAFARVPLAAGERRQVELMVPLRRLAFFDVERDGFALEGGLHRLVLARHCEDAGQACEISLPEVFLGR